MTIRELARLCEVSPATVSRYFNDPDLIKSETRTKIESIVSETNYKPKDFDKIKRNTKLGVICIILPKWRHDFFYDMLTYLENEITNVGAKMIAISYSDDKINESLELINLLNPIGVVFMDEKPSDPFLEQIVRKNVKTVMCAQTAIATGIPSVRIDDMSASYDGTKYLIDKGHKQIGVLSNVPYSLSSGFQRIIAYKKCLLDNNIDFSENNIEYADNTFQEGYEAMVKLHSNNTKITAVFAFSDSMACGAIAAIYDLNLNVPKDIAVLGFDGCAIANEIRPKLTTVKQPLQQIAEHTIKILTSEAQISIIMPHTIFEGESC